MWFIFSFSCIRIDCNAWDRCRCVSRRILSIAFLQRSFTCSMMIGWDDPSFVSIGRSSCSPLPSISIMLLQRPSSCWNKSCECALKFCYYTRAYSYEIWNDQEWRLQIMSWNQLETYFKFVVEFRLEWLIIVRGVFGFFRCHCIGSIIVIKWCENFEDVTKTCWWWHNHN